MPTVGGKEVGYISKSFAEEIYDLEYFPGQELASIFFVALRKNENSSFSRVDGKGQWKLSSIMRYMAKQG